MRKVTKFALLGAPLMMSNAMAYSLIIDNHTEQHLIPYIESMDGLAPDSVNGWLSPGKERIYDKRSGWLKEPSMGVISGSVRAVEIGGASCGNVEFKGVQKIELSESVEGLRCTVSQVPQVTESTDYVLPVKELKVAYTIDKFKNNGDKNIPKSYAVGPTEQFWSHNGEDSYAKSIVTINAVNDLTGQKYPINLEMWRSIGYGHTPAMNNAVVVYDIDQSDYIDQSDFHASYKPELNPDLPEGRYTGIVKIKSQKWLNVPEGKYSFNLGVVINKD